MTVTPVVPIGDLPIPALRRAAQVVFDCPELYLVMSLIGPDYQVAGATDDLDEAARILGQRPGGGSDYRIVQVRRDTHVHDDYDPSVHTCWTEFIRPPIVRPAIKISDIQRVRVIVETASEPFEFTINGPVDAVLLSRRARERFAYPYYQAAFGSAHVAAIRERFGD
jgi:hypothetical protein